jgi:aryl-alcohol dehydrogenase-like predicted oxidoreductase
MDDPVARLVLGTAQLGMDYGVANRAGKPAPATADAVLDLAWKEGLACLDTAQAYGESEAVIGSYLARHPDCSIRVISKLDPALADAGEDDIYAAICSSADRLHGRLDAMLLHNAAMLARWGMGLGRALRRCRDDGIISTIGISVYTPDEFRQALTYSDIRLIQAPFNALDRTLYKDGLIARADEAGVSLHLRSIFLQGLLLLDAETLPPEMAFAQKSVAGWRKLCLRYGKAPAAAALQFAARTVPEAFLVVGCETPAQLAGNIDCLRATSLDAAAWDDIMLLPQAGDRITRPDLWN